MYYTEFRDAIRDHLARHPAGRTWAQLRDELNLPYDRACPKGTKRLESEIALSREKSDGRAMVWKVAAASVSVK